MRFRSGILPAALVATAALAPEAARASFLSGDALDTAAMVLAWIVIVVAPVIAIGLFLVVHVLPEKIAEKNHHPQQSAIKTLCFLSLVFGGMLWPLAWLWAYTRPVIFRSVYGTEKHEHYFVEMGERAAKGELDPLELDHLRDELADMAARGALPSKLRELPALVAQARPRAPAQPQAGAPATGGAR
ncbi:MAG: DUF3302 domain-containing protein [Betaproteobacteria bacterium]|nr:DUF3302 domain-containing protein [Betaproteobacteria bacterium]